MPQIWMEDSKHPVFLWLWGGVSEVCGFAVRGDFLCGFSVFLEFCCGFSVPNIPTVRGFCPFLVRFFGFWCKIYRFFGFRISFGFQIKKVTSFLDLHSFCLKWNASLERTLATKYRKKACAEKVFGDMHSKGNSSFGCYIGNVCTSLEVLSSLFNYKLFINTSNEHDGALLFFKI